MKWGKAIWFQSGALSITPRDRIRQMWSGNERGENPISPEAEMVKDHSFLCSRVISKGDGISILVEQWKCCDLVRWELTSRQDI